MIKIELTFPTLEEAIAFLNSPKSVAPAAPAAEPKGPASTPPVGAEAPRRPGRPKKAEAPPPAAAPAQEVKVAEPPVSAASAPANISEADVRAALMKVNDKHGKNGLAKVGDVLKPFGVTHIRDLKPEQYVQVIAAAEKESA